MIILMARGKIKCILGLKDRKKSKVELQAEEADYYVKALAGAAQRFQNIKAKKSFIEKICNEAKNEC